MSDEHEIETLNAMVRLRAAEAAVAEERGRAARIVETARSLLPNLAKIMDAKSAIDAAFNIAERFEREAEQFEAERRREGPP